MIRDEAWVEREYGAEKWAAVLREIDSIVDGGEMSLARAVAAVNRFERGRPDMTPRPIILCGGPIEVPATFAWAGLYAAIAEYVIGLGAGDTRRLIDMGAGWGRSTFEIWLAGGPRRARYVAAEYTTTGRECVHRLAALAPDMDVSAVPFDYRRIALRDAGGEPGHQILFSVSSADQIPEFSPDEYRRLLDLPGRMDCVHFEPIGWQMRADIGQTGRQGSSAEYALRHDYNRNLWSVVRSLAAAGEIEIVRAEADFAGLNPSNALSILHWRRTAPAN